MEEKRMISKERGEKVAEENGIKFYETSAKDNVNIEHAFITVNNFVFNSRILPLCPPLRWIMA